MINLPGLREPGKRFNVSQSNAKYADQFSGFAGCFGYNPTMDYQGTIFRLPLRTPEQAKKSNLSRQSYTTKAVEDLFDDFMTEAPYMLLFLRNLVSIKLYTWEPGHNEPTLIENKSNELSAKRLHFVSRSEELIQKGKIDETRLDRNFVSYRLRIAVDRPNLSSTRQEWMVGQLFGGLGGRCLQMAYESLTGNSVDGARVPWGGVAALIASSSKTGGETSNKALAELHPQIQKIDGLAFCTLPLPLHTHLPVHVNATFALTDNRRELWLGDDMRGEAKKRSDWNYNLLEEIIAPAYSLVLLEIAKILAGRANSNKIGENCSDFYSIWPHWKDVNRDNAWGFLTHKFYAQIGQHSVFPAEKKTGLRFFTLASPTVVFPEDKRRVFTDVEEVLLESGIQMASLPKLITDSLEKFKRPFNWVTASFVRNLVHKIQAILAAAPPIVISQVFQFCLSDLAIKPNAANSSVLQELQGLAVAPLLQGKLGTLSTPNTPPIFILSIEELALFGTSHEFTLDPACIPYISDYIAVLSQSTNIRPFKPQEFPQFIPKILPAEWYNKLVVSVGPTIGKGWVETFWKYVQHYKLNLGAFVQWPLLPTTDNRLVIISPTIRRICCMVNLPVHACEFFKAIGVLELEATLFSHALGNHSDQLWNYVGRPQLNSLLDCAHSIFSSAPDSVPALFETFTADQRRKLRQFMCSAHHNKLAPDQQDAVRKFPIFEVCDPTTDIFVSLGSEVFLPPSHINPALLTTSFLRVTNSEEEALLKAVGVTQLPTPDFLIRFVFPVISTINEKLREEVIHLALKNMSKFHSNNSFFLEALQNLAFVPTSNKLLKQPRQLYHPKLREQLADILHEDDFPVGTLSSKDTLPYLEKLGLQTDMTREGFLMCTQRVAELSGLEPARSVARGRALLAYIDAHFVRFSAEKSARVSHQYFCSEIMSIKWLPVVIMPEQEGGVPWLRADTLVQAPVSMRPKHELELVGCAKYVLDDSVKSHELLRCFQWDSTPPVSVVAEHLLHLGSRFTPANPVSNITARQNLAIIIPKVYQYLSNFVGRDDIDWSVLQNASIIWNGSYFLPPAKIAFSSPARSNRYLATIPADLTGFTSFLQFLGVRDKYGIEDFMKALVDLALDYSGKILPADILLDETSHE